MANITKRPRPMTPQPSARLGAGGQPSARLRAGPARLRATGAWIACLGFVAAASGCPKVDPKAKNDRFLEDTQDQRQDGEAKMDLGGAFADISGTHLLALAVAFAPNPPIEFLATTALELNSDGSGGTMTLEIQPLAAAACGGDGRVPAGDPLVVENIAVSAEGTFMADFGMTAVDGAANPISCGVIESSLVLVGSIQSADVWCGTVTGMATAPIAIDLAGTTFAATRVEGPDPAGFPAEPIAACPEMGGGETDGMGSSGGTSSGG